jgi:2-oxoisovalerate dehydrogenase E1 component
MKSEARDRALKTAVLIRCVENRLLALFSQGKLSGTVHTCIGEELSGAVAAQFLTGDDYVFSNHRCHGHCIAVTDQVEALIAEIMGKETGLCGGWGGSQHLYYKRFFSNGIQGGFVPITAGLALAEKIRGSSNIACCFIGEGTLGEGLVYESANLMAKWSLPVLVIIENNRFSQSTAQETTLAGEILDRFKAFGLECFDTDTWNLENLYDTVGEAVSYCRSRRKAAVIRIQTDRLMAHSKGDDDRPKELVSQFWERDLLSKFQKEEPERYREYETAAITRIDTAVEAAMAAPYPGQPKTLPTAPPPLAWHKMEYQDAGHPDSLRINELIRNCFLKNMGLHKNIVMIGEDIRDPYGGAFKVTKGLSDKYPERVLNTTISEAAIVGIGNGLSLNGMIPVCEIMFGDFMTLAFDQILNHAAKFSGMYHNQVKNPIIIRSPMGGGRGYGPTHSQSLEKHFLGIPQTTVLYINYRYNPADLYDKLFEEITGPVLVFENKLLYAQRLRTGAETGFIPELSGESWPTLWIRAEGTPDITIVCYGAGLQIAYQKRGRNRNS